MREEDWGARRSGHPESLNVSSVFRTRRPGMAREKGKSNSPPSGLSSSHHSVSANPVSLLQLLQLGPRAAGSLKRGARASDRLLQDLIQHLVVFANFVVHSFRRCFVFRFQLMALIRDVQSGQHGHA